MTIEIPDYTTVMQEKGYSGFVRHIKDATSTFFLV